jgi:hypothetical protein
MKKSALLFAFYLIAISVLAPEAAAQDPLPPPEPPPAEKQQPADQAPQNPCPKITLKGPTQPVKDGAPVRLTASLAGGDKKVDPIFVWSISAGMIRSGQGTVSIEVDTAGAGAERVIQATFLIGGYPPECTSSETTAVPVAPPPHMADEFGALPDAELAARVESIAASVPSGDQVYFMAYAGRTDVRGYASATLRQIRSVAIRSGISGDRLVTLDGGFREQAAFEVWVVPQGAEAPVPSPSINAKDIIFPKPATSASKAKKP